MKNKILKNIKLGLAGLVLAGSLNGCGNKQTKYPDLEEYNPITTEQKDSLFNNHAINPGLKEFIDKVYIIKDEEMDVLGYVDKPKKIVCLAKRANEWTIVHEFAHLRNFVLDSLESCFSERWLQIADYEYGILREPEEGDYFWTDGSNIPKYGLVNPSSTKNMYEDVAEFVECLGDDSITFNGSVCAGNSLSLANLKDQRYQQKLDLLKEYNFLTSEEHEKLSENLGSLNYLLKK